MMNKASTFICAAIPRRPSVSAKNILIDIRIQAIEHIFMQMAKKVEKVET